MLEINKYFEEIAKQRGFFSKNLLRKIHEKGSVQGLSEVPPDLQKIFVTAHDISPDFHVQMQAAFQKHCDAAVSKTVNLRHDATTEDVRRVFLSAHTLGCKGVTVYRDGCRSNQPMALAGTIEVAKSVPSSEKVIPMALPEIMSAVRIKQATPFGNMHIKISVDASGLERELFAQLGKGGDFANSDLEGICRITSLYLRVNGSIEDVASQLQGIGSSISIPTKDGTRIYSLADGLARGIQKYLLFRKANNAAGVPPGDGQSSEQQRTMGTPRSVRKGQNLAFFRLKCFCGGDLIFTESCVKCPSCGYSEC